MAVCVCIKDEVGPIVIAGINQSCVWWHIGKCSLSHIISRRVSGPVPILFCFEEILQHILPSLTVNARLLLSAYFCASCQQHGGSVCGWEAGGGGARDHRAAGTPAATLVLLDSRSACRLPCVLMLLFFPFARPARRSESRSPGSATMSVCRWPEIAACVWSRSRKRQR